MQMFRRGWKQERWMDLVEGVKGLEKRSIDDRAKAITADKVIECEVCGCLLMKDDKHKLPSTIETRPIMQAIQDNTISGISPHGVLHYYSGWRMMETGKTEEYMKEHYRCRRCRTDAPCNP